MEAEEAEKKAAEAREAAEDLAAQRRTRACPELQELRAEHSKEMERFLRYERKSKWLMWTRHARQKLALVEKQSGTTEKMRERHAKTSATLEDRQVAAEMELRSTLEQSERNVRVRLKHMEAYCDGLGRRPASDMPSRVVTERDLRELGQQYNVERNMKQLHQARINVMRDRQAKALEELLERQDREMDRLTARDRAEVEGLETVFAEEEDALADAFALRRTRLDRRWDLAMEVRRREVERQRGLRLAPMEPIAWPQEKDVLLDEGLPSVDE